MPSFFKVSLFLALALTLSGPGVVAAPIPETSLNTLPSSLLISSGTGVPDLVTFEDRDGEINQLEELSQLEQLDDFKLPGFLKKIGKVATKIGGKVLSSFATPLRVVASIAQPIADVVASSTGNKTLQKIAGTVSHVIDASGLAGRDGEGGEGSDSATEVVYGNF